MTRLRLLRTTAGLLAGLAGAAHATLPTVPASTAEPVRALGTAGLLQAAFGLALVIALIFLCAWVARRFGLQTSASGRLLKVVASVMVGQRERVVVVEVGDTWLVLGVAAGQVRALHTLPAEPADAGAAPGGQDRPLAGAFSPKLLDALGKFSKPRKPD